MAAADVGDPGAGFELLDVFGPLEAFGIRLAKDHFDTVLVAVGGGGLIAGIAAWYASKIRIVINATVSRPATAISRLPAQSSASRSL